MSTSTWRRTRVVRRLSAATSSRRSAVAPSPRPLAVRAAAASDIDIPARSWTTPLCRSVASRRRSRSEAATARCRSSCSLRRAARTRRIRRSASGRLTSCKSRTPPMSSGVNALEQLAAVGRHRRQAPAGLDDEALPAGGRDRLVDVEQAGAVVEAVVGALGVADLRLRPAGAQRAPHGRVGRRARPGEAGLRRVDDRPGRPTRRSAGPARAAGSCARRGRARGPRGRSPPSAARVSAGATTPCAAIRVSSSAWSIASSRPVRPNAMRTSTSDDRDRDEPGHRELRDRPALRATGRRMRSACDDGAHAADLPAGPRASGGRDDGP